MRGGENIRPTATSPATIIIISRSFFIRANLADPSIPSVVAAPGSSQRVQMARPGQATDRHTHRPETRRPLRPLSSLHRRTDRAQASCVERKPSQRRPVQIAMRAPGQKRKTQRTEQSCGGEVVPWPVARPVPARAGGFGRPRRRRARERQVFPPWGRLHNLVGVGVC